VRLRLAVALALSLPTAGSAGPLTGGQLEFTVPGLFGPAPLFTGDGTSSGTALSAAHVVLAPGSAFAGTTQLLVSAAPVDGAFLTIGANQGGTFGGAPLGGSDVTIAGRYRLTAFAGVTLLDIAIPLGGAGTQQLSLSGATLMAEHFPWTSGALTLMGIGPSSSTVVTTGSVQTGTPGLVSLVGATRLTSSLGDPSYAAYRLTLSFASVPEPAPWLLLAGGGLALAGARQARMRR
jgi:hypothetical protein